MIGGVSLFGGRGRVSGALFGGLIIAIVATASTSSAIPTRSSATTGVILFSAVTLDTAFGAARRRTVADRDL